MIDKIGTIRNILTGVVAIQVVTDAIALLAETSGTLAADGNEQDIVLVNAPAGVFKPLTIKIDLDLMQAGDTTEIRVYDRIINGGGLQQTSYQTYTGADGGLLNSNKVIYVDLKENRHGIQVTLWQTGGVNRSYDWEYLYES